MGRVLVIVDKPEMSTSVLQLALNGIKEGREHVYVGLFLDQVEETVIKKSEAVSINHPFFSEAEELKIRLGNSFQNDFLSEGISSKVCLGECLNTKQIIKESAFADLLIIDSATFTDYLQEKERFHDLRGVFEKIHCPLLVIPSSFQDFHELIILKESEEKVVQAVKSLKSILTQSLRNAEVSLVGKLPNKEEEFQDEKRLMDFLKQYFRNVGIMLSVESPFDNVALELIKNSQMPLVVMAGIDKSRVKDFILPLIFNPPKNGVSLFIGNPF